MPSTLKIVAGSTLLGIALFQGVFNFHDSPVDAASGSIYGEVRWFHYLHEHTAKQIYASVPDDNSIVTLTNFNSIASPWTITNTGGWKISFAATGPDGKPKPDVVRLCSNKACDSQGFDSDGSVYFEIVYPDTAEWQTKWFSRKIYYLDNTKGCSGGVDGSCEILTSITVTTKNNGPYPSVTPQDGWKVTIGGSDAISRVRKP